MESEKIAFQTKFLPVVRSMHHELTERLGLTNQDVSTTRPEIEKLMQIMAVQLIETGTIAGAHPIASEIAEATARFAAKVFAGQLL